MKPFEENWDSINRSISTTFDLVEDFGYTEIPLTSKNALLPIIYWVHHKGLASRIRSQIGLREERNSMRRWLHTVLLKAIFGGAADTILTAIRRAFIGEEFGPSYTNDTLEGFPADAIAKILKAQGRDPQITNEFIDSLLFTEKEEKRAFTILALLRPDLDFKNNFHLDHLHPRVAFGRSKLR